MKAATLPVIVLASLILLGSAGSAAAQAPVPNLKTTAPYKSLKSYVAQLQERSSTPATAERKRAFRSKLAAKRKAANAKAKAIFKQTINRIQKKDDRQERMQVKRIRQNQKAQVTALNASLAAKLRSIAAAEQSSVDRLNDRYAVRINSLARERTELKRQLKATKNPIKRIKLTRKLDRLQDQINSVYQAKQSALTALETRFNNRTDAANDRFGNRIKNAKASAKRQIQQAHNAWKTLFREEFGDAKEKRSDNFELISDLYERGAGYIAQMPLRTN